MAWKRIVKRTRPSVEVDWETFGVDGLNYIKTNYEDTGKRISFSVSLSEDTLVLTYTSVFKDEASKNEVVNDSTISTEAARRDSVNAANGITKELTVDEEF
jgi:hypothetical protein